MIQMIDDTKNNWSYKKESWNDLEDKLFITNLNSLKSPSFQDVTAEHGHVILSTIERKYSWESSFQISCRNFQKCLVIEGFFDVTLWRPVQPEPALRAAQCSGLQSVLTPPCFQVYHLVLFYFWQSSVWCSGSWPCCKMIHWPTWCTPLCKFTDPGSYRAAQHHQNSFCTFDIWYHTW